MKLTVSLFVISRVISPSAVVSSLIPLHVDLDVRKFKVKSRSFALWTNSRQDFRGSAVHVMKGNERQY